MTVAEQICDRVFMIFKGDKVLDGTMEEIRARFGQDTIRVRTDGGRTALEGLDGVEQVLDLGHYQELRVSGDAQELLRALTLRTTVRHFEQTQPVAARHLHPHRGRRGRRARSPSVKKVVAILRAEYLQAVRSKAFLIGLLVMPVLMGGGIAFQLLVGDQVDLRDRACAVVDPTGELWPVLVAAAEQRNSQGIWEAQPDGEKKQLRPRFLLERYEPAAGERADMVLSQRVEAGELQGFVLVEPEVLGEEPGERIAHLPHGGADLHRAPGVGRARGQRRDPPAPLRGRGHG